MIIINYHWKDPLQSDKQEKSRPGGSQEVKWKIYDEINSLHFLQVVGSDFIFRDITIPRSSVSKDGVVCPFCNTLEKRPTYHMKKYHSESLINAETIFRAKLKDYLHSIRQQRYKDHQDPEDFKKCETKKKRASRQKLKKMNPKKAKAKVKRENDSRKGKINSG